MSSLDPLLSLCLANHPPPSGSDLLTSWSLAPEIVLPLLALAAYGVRQAIGSQRRLVWFGAGWVVLALALTSPLCRAAAIFASAHMVQHVLLVAVAPPLLLLGMRPICQVRLPAVMVGGIYAAAIWLAHAPFIYELALRNPFAHVAVIALLLGASFLFWQAALVPLRSATSDGVPAALLLNFSAMVQTGMLGAIMLFAQSVWYPLLLPRTESFGVGALHDQQLAGAIMWMPMGALYLVAILVLARRWLRHSYQQA